MARVVKGNPGPRSPQWPRVLLVGHGAFGPAHVSAWARLGHLDRLVVADPAPAARAAARAAGAHAVDDYRAVLAEADLVDVVTPSDTHAAITLEALAAGCDVFIEKPMTASLDEADRIARRASRAGRLVQVGYFFRHHPMAIALRHRVRDGEAGPVRWIDADFTSLKRPRRDSGVVLNDAVHFLDLACWLMARPPSEVTALLRRPLGRDVEDIALIALGWPDGAVARVQASCVLPGEHPDPVVPGGWSRKRVAVTGAAGQITADFMTHEIRRRRGALVSDGQGQWRPDSGEPQCDRFGPVDTETVVASELAEFVACARDGTAPSAGAESGVAMAALCEAIARSAREGRTVRLAAMAEA